MFEAGLCIVGKYSEKNIKIPLSMLLSPFNTKRNDISFILIPVVTNYSTNHKIKKNKLKNIFQMKVLFLTNIDV